MFKDDPRVVKYIPVGAGRVGIMLPNKKITPEEIRAIHEDAAEIVCMILLECRRSRH